MKLKDYLQNYTEQELLDQARSFEIKKCSNLRKAPLIEHIVEEFCSEEMLKSRVICLTKEQMDLFQKACTVPQVISAREAYDAIQMNMYWFGGFERETDKFCVFEEVAESFSRIDDEVFREEHGKMGWLVKCVRFFIEYYGVAPVEVIFKLYRLKIKDSTENMIEMLNHMPVDMLASCIFSVNMLGLSKLPKDDPLFSDYGLFVHIPILEAHEFNELVEQQGDKDFYIPSVQQIEEICNIGYEASAIAYKKMESYLIKKMHMTREEASGFGLRVWANSCEGESPVEMIDQLADAGMEFTDDSQLQEFIDLLMDAHNNTRLLENRGHKPVELFKKVSYGGRATIMPTSTQAAALLKEAVPSLEQMGLSVDMDKNADTVVTNMFPQGVNEPVIKSERKVYPNDPCPCGSGKKYKKCCGRR